MPNGPSLALFSHNWLGGDIRGLAGLADSLNAYIPRLKALTGTLSSTARGLTSGPGAWQGQAASAFTGTWARQAATAGAMEDYIAAVATVIGDLAADLSQLEHDLEQAAGQAHAHGAPIDERTGAPVGGPGCGGPLPPGQEALNEYARTRQALLEEAEYARGMAAMNLNSLYEKITNYSGHPSHADGMTADDLLCDLFAAPSAARRGIQEELKAAKGKSLNLKDEIAEAERAGKSASLETIDESYEAKKELEAIQKDLDKANKLENALSKLLDHRVGSVHNFLAKRAGGGRHTEGNTEKDLRSAAEDDPSILDKIVKFGEDVPVVDVAATLAGIGVGTYEDVQGGQPVGSALLDETVSNTAGMVAGGEAAGLVGATIGTRLGVFGGPVGIVAGAVVGYGVGDYVHNFAEDVPADIREHGYAQGLLDAGQDSVFQTADDAGNLAVGGARAVGHAAVSVGHAAEHYWDDVF